MTTFFIELIRQTRHAGETCNYYSNLYSSQKSYRYCYEKFKQLINQYPDDKLLFSCDDGFEQMDISVTTNEIKTRNLNK